jgi:hypothetical protein
LKYRFNKSTTSWYVKIKKTNKYLWS